VFVQGLTIPPLLHRLRLLAAKSYVGRKQSVCSGCSAMLTSTRTSDEFSSSAMSPFFVLRQRRRESNSLAGAACRDLTKDPRAIPHMIRDTKVPVGRDGSLTGCICFARTKYAGHRCMGRVHPNGRCL
jgi:hypothetical protein